MLAEKSLDGFPIPALRQSVSTAWPLTLAFNLYLLMSLLPPVTRLVLFMSAATLLLLIPGPAVFYIVARSVDQGRRAGLASAAGIATGSLGHVIAATVGLSALLVSSAGAYSALRYAGAAYLIYLGIRKFRERPIPGSAIQPVQSLPPRRVYAQGIMVQVLNPKVAIFFFAFLPQFVSPARGHVSLQFFALGLLFAVMGLASDSVWALTAASAVRWLRRNGALARNQPYVAGAVYVSLGIAAAASGSPQRR